MKTLVIGGIHGNEPLGVEVVAMLKAKPLANIDTLIANPRAVKANTRFVDEDLNRSFPGKARGTYEQRRAISVLAKAGSYDLVLDFHNTRADQPSCGFVGLDYNSSLLVIATGFGIDYVNESSYDCINKYALNCLSIEICMRDSNPKFWYEKLKTIAPVSTKKPKLFRYLRRVTWEESKQLGLLGWQPFREISDQDKVSLKITGSACPIFIGSTLTEYYATLVEEIVK